MAGEQYRFRIRMNLSKKVKLSREGTDLRTRRPGCDSKGRERSQSKRVSLNWNKDQDPESVIRDWFGLKAARCGFGLEKMQVVEMGRVTGFKGASAGEDRALGKLQFLSALLEGILSISNVPDFEGALSSGIGSAKAFGFGLLSIAPIRSSDHAAPRPPSASEVS
jgi:CRISPR system Cascade subunit CasE